MEGKERRVSDRSLENLKLGGQARYQGKVRQNFTILPETLEWLRCSGNASSMIDDLVAIAKDRGLKSNHTHERKLEDDAISNNVYKQIEVLQVETEQLRAQLKEAQAKLAEAQGEINFQEARWKLTERQNNGLAAEIRRIKAECAGGKLPPGNLLEEGKALDVSPASTRSQGQAVVSQAWDAKVDSFLGEVSRK